MILALCSCTDKVPENTSDISEAKSFKYVAYDDFVEITKYTGTGGNVKIPEKIGGLPVKSIADKAFFNCETVTSLTMPQTVEKIGEKAFFGCSSLESIVFSDNINHVGSFAFKGTPWLNEQSDDFVVVGDGVLIDYRGAEQKVEIPEGITAFEDAFADNYSITSISLPSTLKTFGSNAFYACTIVKEISINPNPNYIVDNNILYTADKSVLLYRPALASGDSVTVSEETIKINSYAFSNNTKLKSIEFPESLKSIGDYSFDYCTNLEEIKLPKNTAQIGKYSFNYCSSLKKITLGNKIEKIPEGAFASCKSLNWVLIPESVRIIEKNAFYYCSALTDITVPDTASIDDTAFAGTNISIR